MKGYHKALKWLYKTDPYIVIACGSWTCPRWGVMSPRVM